MFPAMSVLVVKELKKKALKNGDLAYCIEQLYLDAIHLVPNRLILSSK